MQAEAVETVIRGDCYFAIEDNEMLRDWTARLEYYDCGVVCNQL